MTNVDRRSPENSIGSHQATNPEETFGRMQVRGRETRAQQ